MYVKEITYEDPFTEESVTRKYYFNLNKAELLELQESKAGGLAGIIKNIIDEHKNEKLIPYFKEIIAMSYGERTPEGGFIKSKERTEQFMASEAYSELFMSFFEADNLISFISGIVPKKLMEEIKQQNPEGYAEYTKAINEANLALNGGENKNA